MVVGASVLYDTLLGPEGAEFFCFFGGHRPPAFPFRVGSGVGCGTDHSFQETGPVAGGSWVGGWGRPFFENCTVDASIFVAKLIRAHGGCLGTRSR